jgi:predicted DNA-binding transcriptional regulator AlpA
MGLAEVHAHTGVSLNTLRNWVDRGQMPVPLAVLRCGRVWDASTIIEWWNDHARNQ